MSIIITPIPSTIELAAPAFTLGTTNTAGAAVTAVASNSTLLAYDTTVPTTIAYSATAAVGAAVVSARRDHTHGMAASDSIAQADQNEAETEADVDKYIAPDFIRYSPGVAKGWCRIEQNGSILGSNVYPNSFNVFATSTGGTGDYLVTWRDDFTQVNYTVSTSCADAGEYNSAAGTFAVGSTQIYNTLCNTGAAQNLRSSVISYGNQEDA